jgi:hypothetical protein
MKADEDIFGPIDDDAIAGGRGAGIGTPAKRQA